MIVYITPFIFCFLISLDHKWALNRQLRPILFVLLATIFCGGLMTGNDWPTYEYNYDHDVSERMEIGYYYYAKLWQQLGIPFVFFRFINKVIVFYIYWRFIDFLRVPFYFTLMIFCGTFALYCFINDPFRSLFSFGFFLLAVMAMLKKNNMISFFLLFIASLFHISTLLILPCFFIKRIQWKSIYIIAFYIIFNISFSSNTLILEVMKLFSWLPFVGDKIVIYLGMVEQNPNLVDVNGEVFTLGAMIRHVCFILMIIYRKKILEHQYGEILFLYAFIYLLLFRIGLSFNVLGRISYFYFIFYISIFSIIKENLSNYRKSYSFSCFILFLLFMYNTLTTSYTYLPYTNIWEYILKGDIPSYGYRENYNYEKSPYRNEHQL